MDNRPIGFFDSGLGGLTCIPYLMDELPNEKIIYFGDTARTPYGSKSLANIRTFSREITNFLVEQDVKMIVIACNTVSATCLDHLREIYPSIPFLGIIDPAAHATASTCTIENKIGIIGTKATIQSNAYVNKITKHNSDLSPVQISCPLFVPLIEEGISSDEIIDKVIQYYMDSFIQSNKLDTLVLGCTHYPIIKKRISRIYPALRIIDPSEEILSSIKAELASQDSFSESPVKNEMEHLFYASDLSENFVNMINGIFENTEYRTPFKVFELKNQLGG